MIKLSCKFCFYCVGLLGGIICFERSGWDIISGGVVEDSLQIVKLGIVQHIHSIEKGNGTFINIISHSVEKVMVHILILLVSDYGIGILFFYCYLVCYQVALYSLQGF
eukprot:TRINITY_DN2528_c2_g2_i4.p4 TRINITY_DN2528_c2_g2~~TRINITY_DN2528_c2_g2_i4.p4  ORF type:complete len:108 (+),score=0.67 TRINITY_DN2528_c2_g2_i4:925-1248(+)